jgi:hypothetical protein
MEPANRKPVVTPEELARSRRRRASTLHTPLKHNRGRDRRSAKNTLTGLLLMVSGWVAVFVADIAGFFFGETLGGGRVVFWSACVVGWAVAAGPIGIGINRLMCPWLSALTSAVVWAFLLSGQVVIGVWLWKSHLGIVYFALFGGE